MDGGWVCLISLINLDKQVISDVRRIVADAEYVPREPRELCARIFTTCYMATVNSSQETRRRAKDLAAQIGRCVRHVPVCACVACVRVTCVYARVILLINVSYIVPSIV